MFNPNITAEEAIDLIINALISENMDAKMAKHLLNKLVETVIREATE